MSNLRPQPQAKYKLLLENTRPPVDAKLTLVAIVLILSIIGATGIAVLLARKSLSSVEDSGFLMQMIEMTRNQTVSPDSWHQRIYLYGMALKNNMNVESWVLPSLPTGLKPPNSKDVSNNGPESYKLVCYYTLSQTNLQPKNIDASLCTHINVGFATVVNSTLSALNPGDEEIYRQVVALKTPNPKLKVLLSVGGSSTGLNGFSVMVSSKTNRAKFINSTIELLKAFQFDGIDFDWEFPAWQSDPVERAQFTQLLKELQIEFDNQKLAPLVSVAVAAPQPIIDQAYDVIAMAKYVDFINLMAYDYHFYVWYMPMTGLNAPLYPRRDETGYMRTLNTNFTAWYWLSKGMPAHKIIVGLPTYGHSFTLVNSNNHGLSAPSSGNGILGSSGFTTYVDACWFLTEGRASGVFDLETRTPYAFRGKEWISYDDERSLAYKAEFVTSNQYGGAMILSLNMDDHSGRCSQGRVTFPLTRQVANTLQDDQL